MLYLIPFLHQTTTSTVHNTSVYMLYLIPFLHQTTTDRVMLEDVPSLYLIPFLHQTTTWIEYNQSVMGCILFHFYIKPQP